MYHNGLFHSIYDPREEDIYFNRSPHKFLLDLPPQSQIIQPLSSQVRSRNPPPPPFTLTKRIVMRKIPLPCLLPQLFLQDFFFTPLLAYPTLHFLQLPLSPRLDFVSLTCIRHTPPLAVTVCVNYPPPSHGFPLRL